MQVLILFIVLTFSGCGSKEQPATKEKALTKFQESYVVGENDNSLPYYEGWQDYNSLATTELISQLAYYDKDKVNSYVLVDNEGNIMEDDEFERDPAREYSEELVFADEIKNYPLFIVKKDSCYVTTAEKEIDALLDGNRDIFNKDDLKNILKVNEEAYKDKDYESINSYLMKKEIKVWNPNR